MNNNIFLAGLCACLMACGGSGGGGSTRTGTFVDSAVANIGYRTESFEGVTNALGEYQYLDGETVTFFIGDLELPSVPASGTVTPLDLAASEDITNPTVVNIIRLIQSLDEDGNPDNGISISDTAKGAATQVDFGQSIEDFEKSSAVTTLVANSGSSNTVLISQNDATAHFEGTLRDEDLVESFNFDAETLPGVYQVVGTQDDDFAGTHQYTFNADGTVDIVYEDNTTDSESWSVNDDGRLVFSGTVADIFTLTSGSQSSGNMNIVIDDNDGSPVLNTKGTIERTEEESGNEFRFNAETLPGVYQVVGTQDDDFAGTHQYTFNADGTVDIVYEDNTTDSESWSVNDDGRLVFSGTVADIFTLTSGSQSSGNMTMVIDDNDGSPVLNTQGTIQLTEEDSGNEFRFNAETLPGVYQVVGTQDDDFAGTHQYTFNADGTVDIVYEDNTTESESWSVNDDGRLVFSGTVADIFTLTSGSQSSGNMTMVIDDNDGSPVLNTQGTIQLAI